MTTIILGNANNLSVSDDNSIGDTIILGDGIDDTVSANSSSYDTISLGTGSGDTVSASFSSYEQSASAMAPVTLSPPTYSRAIPLPLAITTQSPSATAPMIVWASSTAAMTRSPLAMALVTL